MILFEMLSGELPYKTTYDAEDIYQWVSSEDQLNLIDKSSEFHAILKAIFIEPEKRITID